MPGGMPAAWAAWATSSHPTAARPNETRRGALRGAPFSRADRVLLGARPGTPRCTWTWTRRAVGGVGSPAPLLQGRPRSRRARSRGGKRVARRGRSRSRPTGTRRSLFAVLGHKADLGVMALGPDLARLQAFQHELSTTPLEPVVLVRVAHRAVGVHRDRGRRAGAARGRGRRSSGDELEERLAAWRERIAHYREQPPAPAAPAEAARSASTRCRSAATTGANWYELPFDERKQLMAGHARVGRTYAGRVLQLITGSTGLDDWEWGVTLLADDPVALKEIVYEMRFDPVSARVRRVRSVLHRAWCSSPPTRCARVGLRRRVAPAVDHVRLFVVVPRGARRPPDDLRDREAVRRRAEHPARQRRGALGLGDPRARRQPRAARRRRSPTSRSSAAPSTAWKATSSRDDPREGESGGRARLAEASAAIVEGVERELPGWVRAQVRPSSTRGGASTPAAACAGGHAPRDAGVDATARLWHELRELFALDPARRRRRRSRSCGSAYREPTAVLAAAGIPPVERDELRRRAWPDDRYGLVPRTLGDLGDPELAPLLLAWGIAKAAVLRARAGSRADRDARTLDPTVCTSLCCLPVVSEGP